MRPAIRSAELPAGQPLVVFDEIHKYARWRNLLKGLWDTEKSRRKFVVTGSARLDYSPKRRRLAGGPLPQFSPSPILSSGAEELDHKTVERWLQMLENMYLCFRVAPFGVPRIRAVKKERKLYLWDWSAVADPGARFENLVASQLLKYCHYVEDTEGYGMELRFLRDTDKREVDFVVLRDRRPLFAVECKSGDQGVGAPVRYFAERTPIPAFYQVHRGERHFASGKVTVLPFGRFCAELGMP